MTRYSLALFLHIVGALGLFVAIGLEWAGLSGLRRAASVEQAREWLPVLGAPRKSGGPAALALIVSGVYLMVTQWRGTAWPGIGLLALVLIAVLGAVLTGRRMGPMAQALATARGTVAPELRERLVDPMLVMSAWLRTSLAVGVVYIMCVKPGAAGSLTSLGVAVALGALAGLAALPARTVVARPE